MTLIDVMNQVALSLETEDTLILDKLRNWVYDAFMGEDEKEVIIGLLDAAYSKIEEVEMLMGADL